MENGARDLETARRAAFAAGATLLKYYEKLEPSMIQTKSARRDLVSEADVAAEKVILNEIRAAFPDDAIHAEESSRAAAGDAGAIWYIDPLDGTTNFVHGLPEFTVSIARFIDNEPAIGVVYAPRLDELYIARKGGGAYRNGAPIFVSKTPDLADALVATGFPYRRSELANPNLENFGRLFFKVRDLRRLGSAALDLAFVACGRFDAYWELNLERHDVAAGALIVREAGGRVTDLSGGDAWKSGRSILATNGELHEILRNTLIE
ncbi:MAG: inositol monophosphatase [Planctomycetes bacterium]|nr:inositol monophosphatase [Planctomycetota bacterium]